MLLCLTKVDDLPDVKYDLTYLASKKGWKINFINAPKINDILLYCTKVKVIFMNPNKSHIVFDKKTLKKFTNLEVFCTASTGTVHIDLAAANELNIRVISIKKYTDELKKIPSTAELAFALTLDALRNVSKSHKDTTEKLLWDFEKYIGKQIKDLNVGIIGYGRLGSIYARMMKNSGAKLKILDPKLSFDFKLDVKKFIEVASELDVVSMHLHAEDNENFIDKKFLNALSSDIIIVNTSRGEIINHDDLFKFLDNNPNAMYCTDVLPNENNPIMRNKILKKFSQRPNVLITQHIGGMSTGARKIAFGLACNLLLNEYGLQNE